MGTRYLQRQSEWVSRCVYMEAWSWDPSGYGRFHCRSAGDDGGEAHRGAGGGQILSEAIPVDFLLLCFNQRMTHLLIRYVNSKVIV